MREQDQFHRLLQLLALLPTRPMGNTQALALDLKVDPRSIRRYGAMLAEAGLIRYAGGCLWIEAEQVARIERFTRFRALPALSRASC